MCKKNEVIFPLDPRKNLLKLRNLDASTQMAPNWQLVVAVLVFTSSGCSVSSPVVVQSLLEAPRLCLESG